MATPTILVIEDNPLNLELVRDVLLAAGFAVVDARLAEEGLEIAARLGPDLILLDIRLPGMDGYQALERLKSNPATATIPVMALTAQAMIGDREQALAAGFVGYIAKPVNTRTLAEEVRSLLERSRSRRAASDG
jgi:two-component system cell cycle response regulator DivK